MEMAIADRFSDLFRDANAQIERGKGEAYRYVTARLKIQGRIRNPFCTRSWLD